MARVAKVHAVERLDRAKRFGISLPNPGGRARRVYFKTRAERDRELRRAVRLADREGVNVFSVSAADVRLIEDLREILPDGVDPREAARFYVAHNAAVKRVSFGDARREYEHALELRRLDGSYLDHVRSTLDRLGGWFGVDREVSEFAASELVSFFAELPFAAVTLAGEQQRVSSFFEWARACEFCERNPMTAVARVTVPESEPEFMSPEHTRRLFEACVTVRPRAAPMLALAFFAGLRTSSILRLERSDLRFEQRGILLPGAQHKTGRRFYVEGFEPVLWEWLEPWRELSALDLPGSSTFIGWRAAVYTAARVPYPKNVGRHSFCTYHIALKGDATKTASLLTHRGSVSMLYNHYRGNATREDAVAFFGVRPD